MLLRRLWLVVLSTAAIVLMLPRSGVVTYDYEVDHPWKYDALIAKHEIPLYKSEKELKAEYDSLLNNYEPYYNTTVAVREKALQAFNEKYGKGLPGLPSGYSAYVAKRIRNAYDLGIVSTALGQEAQKDTLMRIRLVSGNTATSVYVRDIMTPLKAYEWIFSDPLM